MNQLSPEVVFDNRQHWIILNLCAVHAAIIYSLMPFIYVSLFDGVAFLFREIKHREVSAYEWWRALQNPR